jgi:hypothetical protein
MSLNSAASAASPSQKWVWPESLDTIKITEAERDLLEAEIESVRKKFLPKTAGNYSFFYALRDSSICPRRLCISNDHCFVVLNSHGGMPKFDATGLQQKKITYVWDCIQGGFWLKKACLSTKQIECIRYLKYAPDLGQSSLGLPSMVADMEPETNKGKIRYFEKMATLPLLEWSKQYGVFYDFEYIIGLMDALRKIHSVKYQPSTFYSLVSSASSSFTQCSFYVSHTLFHGDISPNNIICEKIEDKERGRFYPRLMLTDFYGLGDVNNIVWTRGWASPECIQFAKTRTKYQDMDVSSFMTKYGAKKDTWAMGLIIGSLILSDPNFKQLLLSFSFITNKLKFDPTGQFVVDETGLADITQEEIDAEIDAFIERTPSPEIKLLWGCVKRYLTVDPDKRPTMKDCFLNLSRERFIAKNNVAD